MVNRHGSPLKCGARDAGYYSDGSDRVACRPVKAASNRAGLLCLRRQGRRACVYHNLELGPPRWPPPPMAGSGWLKLIFHAGPWKQVFQQGDWGNARRVYVVVCVYALSCRRVAVQLPLVRARVCRFDVIVSRISITMRMGGWFPRGPGSLFMSAIAIRASRFVSVVSMHLMSITPIRQHYDTAFSAPRFGDRDLVIGCLVFCVGPPALCCLIDDAFRRRETLEWTKARVCGLG